MLNKKESALDKPLEFFNYFICENGLSNYKKQFFSGLDLETFGFPVIKIDKMNYTYSYYYANDDGAVEVREVSLFNNIKKTLEAQENISLLFINEKIHFLNDKGIEVTNYLKLILGELSRLSEIIKNKPELLNNNLNQNIYNIVKKIYDKYNLFINKQIPIISEALNFKQANQITETKKITNPPKEEKKVTAFKWKNNPEKSKVLINNVLTTLKIIEENDISKFETAFKGEEIKEPLNIKWKLKSSHNSYSAALIRFIKLLIKLNLIDSVDNAEIANKIKKLFVAVDGIPFNNLGVKVNDKTDNPKGIKENELHLKINELFPDKNT